MLDAFSIQGLSFTFAQVMTVFGSLAVLATLAKPVYAMNKATTNNAIAMNRLSDSLDHLAEVVNAVQVSQAAMGQRIGGLEAGQASLDATVEQHDGRISRLEADK